MSRFLAGLLCVLSGLDVHAAPSWASAGDKKDAGGSTFICEGAGRNEEDALAAAHGICNDKVCRVCGVEIESVVETKETLKGIDFVRKVVERCRRVRTQETRVQYKSVDCGPNGCTAWIQVLYTKDDERAECPAYAKESFADPALCEADIEAFKKVPGRTAASFYARKKLLDDALGHCDKIDVRPTPAIMALDAKLNAGMDAFEFTSGMQDRFVEDRQDFFGKTSSAFESSREATLRYRPFWAWYLTTYGPLRQAMAESKYLTDRIRLVRDLVANKALVFDVLEAALAPEWDTPAGLARLLDTLKKAPVGKQYGAPKVHFSILSQVGDAKTNNDAINAFLRSIYPPTALEGDELFEMAKFFDGDRRVSPAEWDYVAQGDEVRRQNSKGYGCPHCMRTLIAVQDHGGPGIRTARLKQALEQLAPKDTPDARRKALMSVIPLADAQYALDVAKELPAPYQALYDRELYLELTTRLDYPPVPKVGTVLAERALATFVAAGMKDERMCSELHQTIEKLEKYKPDLRLSDAAVCACLDGPLAQDRLYEAPKNDLFKLAVLRDLSCIK